MEPDRWLRDEVRHFLALEAVPRERSFAKAAASLAYPHGAVPQPPRGIAQLDLIGHKHCRTLARTEAAFRPPLRYVFPSDHNQTVQALVSAGVGAALVPRLTMDEADETTVLLELPRIPPRVIALAWHRDRY